MPTAIMTPSEARRNWRRPIHRAAEKGPSRKLSFRCIGFPETGLPALADSRKLAQPLSSYSLLDVPHCYFGLFCMLMYIALGPQYFCSWPSFTPCLSLRRPGGEVASASRMAATVAASVLRAPGVRIRGSMPAPPSRATSSPSETPAPASGPPPATRRGPLPAPLS